MTTFFKFISSVTGNHCDSRRRRRPTPKNVATPLPVRIDL
jgi:hypothetical protein